MSVLVFADVVNGKIAKAAFEATTYGSKIASQLNTTCTVVTHGNIESSVAAELGVYGASKVLLAKNNTAADNEQLTKLIAHAATDESSKIIILPHDYSGKAIAGRVAARLNAGLVSGAIALPETSSVFSVKKAVFSGKAFANYEVKSDVKVISVMPNSVGAEKSGSPAQVTEYNKDLGAPRVVVKEVKKKGGEGISLTEADIVVSAGRGLKGPENWGIIETLAKELGAATACSRPVSDIGWRPHHEHVGQTGTAIRPNLYFAIGISGAIQHLAGVNGSKVIVVVNTDPEAPFFKAADYGVVGDAFDVIPKLTEAVKKFKASHN
jgi:electron transfer flavoprotein alpha subunit